MPMALKSLMPSPKPSSCIQSYTAVLVITNLASAQQFDRLRKDHGQSADRPVVGSGIANDVDGSGASMPSC